MKGAESRFNEILNYIHYINRASLWCSSSESHTYARRSYPNRCKWAEKKAQKG